MLYILSIVILSLEEDGSGNKFFTVSQEKNLRDTRIGGFSAIAAGFIRVPLERLPHSMRRFPGKSSSRSWSTLLMCPQIHHPRQLIRDQAIQLHLSAEQVCLPGQQACTGAHQAQEGPHRAWSCITLAPEAASFPICTSSANTQWDLGTDQHCALVHAAIEERLVPLLSFPIFPGAEEREKNLLSNHPISSLAFPGLASLSILSFPSSVSCPYGHHLGF